MLEESLELARAASRSSLQNAGVTIRPVVDFDAFPEMRALFDGVWQSPPDEPTFTVELLQVLSKLDACVLGAYDGDVLVGANVGMYGPPSENTLYSHVAAVLGSHRGRNVGLALKQYQRVWALERGVTSISWTFDPLVGRNANFNINRLGAMPSEYLINFYGVMNDLINQDDPSDRLLMRWDLLSPAEPVSGFAAAPALSITEDGAPKLLEHPDSEVVSIAVPQDIEALRLSDPALATEWRFAVREALEQRIGAGGCVVGFDTSSGYIVDTRKTAG